MPNSCLPFTSCFNSLKQKADLNKDGKVDLKDLQASASAIEKFLQIDPEKAKAKLAEFIRKIDKLQTYLAAVKIIFQQAKDDQIVTAIDLALKALAVIEVSVDMVNALGGKVENFTVPQNIQEVGATISDLQDTNISMRVYAEQFAKVLNIGFDAKGFDAISAALAKVAAAQKLWVGLGSARVIQQPTAIVDPAADTTAASATPTVDAPVESVPPATAGAAQKKSLRNLFAS